MEWLQREVPSINGWMSKARFEVQGHALSLIMLDAIGLELAKKKNIDMFIRNFFHNFFQTELSVKYAMSDSTEIEAEYEKFAKQREQGEKTITQEIMMSIDMEEEESSLPEGDLKLVMGYDIKEVPTPLKDIQEEEKKIDGSGYRIWTGCQGIEKWKYVIYI